MQFREWRSKVLSTVFRWYLALVRSTARLEISGEELLREEHIIGFWHEDSSIMNLVLERVASESVKLLILITSAVRGDVIERLVQYYGAEGFRVDYAEKGTASIRRLMRRAMEKVTIAVAWDGPSGPLHEPKKLPFLLAARAGKSILGISVRYSAALRLPWRWDRYVVPLPFTRISAMIRPIALPEKSEWKDAAVLRQTVDCLLPES